MGSKMLRYVALVTLGQVNWTVRFPDFPGVEASGFPLHVALWKAQRDIGERAMILRSLGVDMPAPMPAAEVVLAPGYKGALPFLIAVPARVPEGNNVVGLPDLRKLLTCTIDTDRHHGDPSAARPQASSAPWVLAEGATDAP